MTPTLSHIQRRFRDCQLPTAIAALAVAFGPLHVSAQSATNCAARIPGLVSWWPGDGVALDIVGTYHATLQNGASANGTGLAGAAFLLDGIDDQVLVPSSPAVNLTRNSGNRRNRI